MLILGFLVQAIYIVVQAGRGLSAQAEAVVGDALFITALHIVLRVGPTAGEEAGVGRSLSLGQGICRSVVQLTFKEVIAAVGLHCGYGLLPVIDGLAALVRCFLIQTLVVIIQVGGGLSTQTVSGEERAVLVTVSDIVFRIDPAAGKQLTFAFAIGYFEGHQAAAGVLAILAVQLISVAILSNFHFRHTIEQDRIVLAIFDGRVILQPNAVGEGVEASGTGDSLTVNDAHLFGDVEHLNLAGGIAHRVTGHDILAVQVGVVEAPLPLLVDRPALCRGHHLRGGIGVSIVGGRFRRFAGRGGRGGFRRFGGLGGRFRISRVGGFFRVSGVAGGGFRGFGRFGDGTGGGTRFRICQVGGHGRAAEQHGQSQGQGEHGSQFLFQVHDVGASC